MRLLVFLIGIVVGLIPGIGLITGLVAWGEALNGNEAARGLYALVHGVLLGTVLLVILLFTLL